MENYSTIKKNGIMPFATTWMVLEFIILSEVAKKDKYHMISLFVESKRYKWTYMQNRNRPIDIKNKVTKGKGRER